MRPQKPCAKNILFAICGALFAVAFAVYYAVYAKNHIEENLTLTITIIGALLSVLALAVVIGNVKKCILYFRYKKIMDRGTDVICRVIDCKRYNLTKHMGDYAIILQYELGGTTMQHVTDDDFVKEEYLFLKNLNNITCRVYNGDLVITQKLPQDASLYGHIKSQVVLNFIKLWQAIAVISVICLLVMVAITIIFNSSLYLTIGAGCALGINLVCGIIFVIFLLTHKK